MARTILHTGADALATATVAAATATRCAAAGRRTLLLSTGPEHHAGDVLGAAVGSEPGELGGGLWGARADARAELAARSPALAAWLAVRALPPGTRELAAGLALARHARDDAWDVVVVDAGPPAAALRLLELPEAAHGWLAQLAPSPGRLLEALRPWVGAGTAGEAALGAAAGAARALAGLEDVLGDPERCTARLVTREGAPATAAARRMAAVLALRGVALDAVVVLGAADAATAALAPVPVRAASAEAGLDALAAELWDGAEPDALLHRSPALEVVVGRGGASVHLPLPHAERDELALHRVAGALVVSLGEHRRTVPLPAAVADYRPAGARLTDGVLHVELRPPAP